MTADLGVQGEYNRSVTIEVYDGWFDHVPRRDPDWSAKVGVYEGDWLGSCPASPPHDADTTTFSDRIDFDSGPVEIHAETDNPIWLFVHTNDRYHHPDDWNKPVEHGLVFGPDIRETEPFGCEVWGRVVMWAAKRERGSW